MSKKVGSDIEIARQAKMKPVREIAGKLNIPEEQVLATLPSDRWYVQRFALVAGHRIPFLVLGEYGVFALWAIGWRPQWTDPAFVSDIASNLKHRLPSPLPHQSVVPHQGVVPHPLNRRAAVMRKVVLAYSGGLDTSVIVKWLRETYDAEIVTFAADIGQEEELRGLSEKARNDL